MPEFEFDFDPKNYNAWQLIGFERVVGKSLFDVLGDDDEVSLGITELLGLSWVKQHTPEPSWSIERARREFADYAKTVDVAKFMEELGAQAPDEPDPTPAAPEDSSVGSSTTSGRSSGSTTSRRKSSAAVRTST